MNVLMQEQSDLNRFLDVANFTTVTPLVVQYTTHIAVDLYSHKS
jgi:hypothetical protein